MSYRLLLETVWHPPLAFAHDIPMPCVPELEVQALWQAGVLGREFRSECGAQICIQSFGRWNLGPGAPFVACEITYDAARRRGAIVFEPRNKQLDDGNESHAILKVVLSGLHTSCQTHRPAGTHNHHQASSSVPRIVVGREKLAEALDWPLCQTAIPCPGRCYEPLRELPTRALETLLTQAALRRAQRRAQRLLISARTHSLEQAFFEACARVAGGRNNRLAMTLLAQRVPLERLEGHCEQVLATLLGAAGLLSPSAAKTASDNLRPGFTELWQYWEPVRARFEPCGERRLPWQLQARSQSDMPFRQVVSLAVLVSKWPQFYHLATARPFCPRALVDFLIGLSHPLWSHVRHLGAVPAPRPHALWARSQAQMLLTECLIPLALHEGRMSLKDYLRVRSAPRTDGALGQSVARLFGTKLSTCPWARRLAYQQGIMQVDNDFCLEENPWCEPCAFPDVLMRYRP